MHQERKIIHVDMDSFYASIEMRDHPAYRQVPLVIARDPRHANGKGVVATANYIARQYGIHSAMSCVQALKLCPQAVFKRPDFDKYRQVSEQIHAIFRQYTDIIEPIALDEAYLDVTENKLNECSAIKLAHDLQQKIYAKTQLTCSVGISYNKFLAKLSSEYRKPMGLTVVRKEEAQAFLLALPIQDFRGVGKKTLPKMNELGIFSGQDLYNCSLKKLQQHFGKMGVILYQRVRGEDNRIVQATRKRKSLGKERTFDPPLCSQEEVEEQLKRLAQKVTTQMQKKQKQGQTLVLKVRNSRYQTMTKRLTQRDFFTNDVATLVFYSLQLFEQIQPENIDVRLLGLTLTGLDDASYQNIVLPLWQNENEMK